jgi:hypothetical protein
MAVRSIRVLKPWALSSAKSREGSEPGEFLTRMARSEADPIEAHSGRNAAVLEGKSTDDRKSAEEH